MKTEKTVTASKSNGEDAFKESLLESISVQYAKFEYYRNLCKIKGLNLEDLKKAVHNGDYYILPGVASLAFKRSKGLVNHLNDLGADGKFQVSSSTSGDPSYIYTNPSEIDRILNHYVDTFGLKGVSKAIAFAPTTRILASLSRKAGYMDRKSIARLKFAIDAANLHYDDITFSLDVNMFKSIFSLAFRKKPSFDKLSMENLTGMLQIIEREKQTVAFGGVVLLMMPYLQKMKPGQFNFHDKMHVVLSGGGYSGRKGGISGDKISKPDLARLLIEILGIDRKYLSSNFKDIYGFTECPITHEGFWNSDINDFMFTAWPESKVYIVDPETEKPLKTGKGLFKVIAPCGNGNPCSANVSLIQYDMVSIFGIKENYQVKDFSHISRYKTAGLEGCALKADAIANS